MPARLNQGRRGYIFSFNILHASFRFPFEILEMLNAEMRPLFTIDIGQVKADAGHSVP